MKCLFCGKELALLKRLTNGGDFCSEAHRQSYQNQFNELALGRLRQVQLVQQRFVAQELARDEYGDVGVMTDAEDDEVPEATFVTDIFEAFSPDEPHPQGLNSAEIVTLVLSFPAREFSGAAHSAGVNLSIPAAKPLKWSGGARPMNYSSAPRAQALDARDISRKAALPVWQPDSSLNQQEVFVPAANQEACPVKLAPRSPAQAQTWRARAPGFEQLEATLGGWIRLDGAPVGSQDWVQPSSLVHPLGQSSVVESAQATANLATLGQAVAQSFDPPAPKTSPSVPPVPSAPEPERVMKPVPVTLHGVGPTSVLPSTVGLGASRNSEPRVPVAGALPLRPVMLVATAPAGAARPPVTPAPAAKASQTAAPPVAKVTPTPSQPATRVTPEEARREEARREESRREDARREEARREEIKREEAKREEAKREEARREREMAAAPEPAVEEAPQRKVASSKVRRDVRIVPAQPAARGAGKPQDKTREAPAESARPLDLEVPALKLVTEEKGFAALSQGAKVGIGAGVVAALVVVWLLVSSGAPKPVVVDPNASRGYEVGAPVVNMGWMENWAPADSGKHISLFKGSQQLSDYRVEFKAVIQSKAIGWMFRGMNPRNYYVAKIETVKPGVEPTIALVRYAVIDGKPEGRTETALPFKTHPGMTYDIRFEAVRSKFTAWVNDQKVEEWQDTRIGSGAIGMYSEAGEAAVVDGIVNLTVLVPK